MLKSRNLIKKLVMISINLENKNCSGNLKNLNFKKGNFLAPSKANHVNWEYNGKQKTKNAKIF